MIRIERLGWRKTAGIAIVVGTLMLAAGFVVGLTIEFQSGLQGSSAACGGGCQERLESEGARGVGWFHLGWAGVVLTAAGIIGRIMIKRPPPPPAIKAHLPIATVHIRDSSDVT